MTRGDGASGRQDRVAVVTGATGGMGAEIARSLLDSGARVVTIARDPRRANMLRDRFGPNSAGLTIVPGDLSIRSELTRAAWTIAADHPRIDLLVNNAGAHFPDRSASADGLEMHVAVDYMASYALMRLLSEPLRRGRARVVNVASDTLNDTRQVKILGRPRPATLDLRDVSSIAEINPASGFVPFEAYARAKLMLVTAGFALADLWSGDGVTVNAVHPGIVATDIIDDLVPPLLRPFSGIIRSRLLTPAEGAAATLRLATDPTLKGVTGRYFNRVAESPTPSVAARRSVQARLIELSDQFLRG